MSFLPPPLLSATISRYLLEDAPSFDVGAHVVGDNKHTAILWMKAPGVLSGVPFFNEIFLQLHCTVEWLVKEGDWIDATQRTMIAKVSGKACDLLLGERTALNLLARASGISTRAFKLNQVKEKYSWRGVIAGTRKTTPGFRLVEKYAMVIGGIDTHRMDLSSMVMIKDNHVWANGDIPNAVAKARKVCGFSVRIEEALAALGAGADIVMLDNFIPKNLHEAAAKIKKLYPNCLIEGFINDFRQWRLND